MALTWDELYPLRGLRVRASNDLELRWLDDDLLLQLAAVAHEGIHDPAWTPFTGAWADGTPAGRARSVVQRAR